MSTEVEPSSDLPDSTTWIIVGVVLVAVLLVAIALGIFFYRRHRSSSIKNTEELADNGFQRF